MSAPYHPAHRTGAALAVVAFPPAVQTVYVTAVHVDVGLLLPLRAVGRLAGQYQRVQTNGALGTTAVDLFHVILQFTTTLWRRMENGGSRVE